MLRRTDQTEKDDAGTTWTTGTAVNRVFDHALSVDGKTVAVGTTLEAYRDNLAWVCITGKILIGDDKHEMNLKEEVAAKKGDVNEDGKVDISDIVAVINQIAGTASFRNSDVNGDEKVDISDIVAIINIIANGGDDDQSQSGEEPGGDDSGNDTTGGESGNNGEEAIEVLAKQKQ